MNSTKRRSTKINIHLSQNTTIFLLLFTFAMISILSSAKLTVTLDEPQHFRYGARIFTGDSDREIDSPMPISTLNVLPVIMASLMKIPLKSILGIIAVARTMTIAVSILVAYLVFYWSRELYGFIPAIFSCILFIFDPNIIAHSQLVSTDLYALGAICLTFYRLWRFANNRTLKNSVLFLLAFGLSQIVKYTAITLFPLCLIALFLHDWPEFIAIKLSTGKLFRFLNRYVCYVLITISASILIINAGFLFNRTFTRFGDYQFRSAPFIHLQNQFPFLQKVPIPVPYPYLEGLDWMLNTEQTGERYGNVYLLGQLSNPKGFLGYYFIAYLLKVPIASQIILLGSLIAYFFDKNKRKKFLMNEVFIFAPIIFFFVYFNLFFNTQTGIRYYLVIFPLVHIVSANFFVDWGNFLAARKSLGIMLIIFLIGSVLANFPHYIPYFNEIIWDKTQTYKYLSDSNLDFGQGRIYLEEYLSSHPDARYAPATIQSGTLVVGGSDLVGILEDPNKYAWLRNNFEPVDMIANCYFIYKITPEEIRRLCNSTEYCK